MSWTHHYSRLDLGRRVAIRALIAFLITFVVLRMITAIIHFELLPHGPFRNLITRSGLHIHTSVLGRAVIDADRPSACCHASTWRRCAVAVKCILQ
jgi:hypothetical protein